MHIGKILFLSAFMLCTILVSFSAYAANNTFSIYGTVMESNGTPIPGTTIRLDDPGSSTAITDSEGRFQFVNVTTDADECGITISYPDGKQYFPPGNSFRLVPASGVQYANVTRIAVESDATPGFEALIVLASLVVVAMITRDHN